MGFVRSKFLVKLMAVMVLVMVEGKMGMELCNMDENGIRACRPYVTQPNPMEDPSEECCGALTKADLQCLCGYRNSFLLPSLGIDPALALALPKKCGLTPPTDC
ncbi:hypothetical protein Leryth_014326 [Lithospermum erythrorhizon]|nr:hypothetical protein Leryth_014326 [Lithospermum erythrorhizon]